MTVADVLAILAEFGCTLPTDCSNDVDGDDAVTVSDVLLVLSHSVQTVDGASEDTRAGGHKLTQPMVEQGVLLFEFISKSLP